MTACADVKEEGNRGSEPPPPPPLENSNFLYIHSGIHSKITKNIPRPPSKKKKKPSLIFLLL